MTASLRAVVPTALVAAALVTATPAASAAPAPADRVSRSAEGFAAEHAPDALREPGTLKESRTPAAALVRQPKSSGTRAALELGGLPDAWIYDARVSLFYDHDGDGFYRYLRVTIDADTIYTAMYVYAALFLSADGETWEEYHVTDDFLIRGESSADAYEVETELLAGYPPGEYDLLIELYDADYGVLVDEYGPRESSALALLPLEDAAHDAVRPSHFHGGGGSGGWPLIALLAGAALAGRLRRLSPPR